MLAVEAKLQERAKCIHDARTLLEKAKGENRGLSAEETEQWNRLHARAKEINVEVEQYRQQREAEETLEQRANERLEQERRGDDDARETRTGTKEYGSAFRNWLLRGNRGLDATELRALQQDSDEAGGYTVASEQFVARLIKAVDDIVYLRGWATVLPLTSAKSLGVPSLDADPADADWTTELQTGNEDSTMDFGKRTLTPHPLAKRIKVSRTLVRTSALDIEGLVTMRLGYKFGVTEEKAYLTGSGTQQALGVFTASALGISTGRDVSTGNTTTALTFNGLKSAKWALKPQYLARSRWLFHRDAGQQIDKLVDGAGRYIWEPSTQINSPDMLLGRPCSFSEYAPNTFTTGQYVGMIADFSWYWIAESLSMQMQRLDELYAETNQIGFIGRRELDGMPVLEEAFVRVKLA